MTATLVFICVTDFTQCLGGMYFSSPLGALGLSERSVDVCA